MQWTDGNIYHNGMPIKILKFPGGEINVDVSHWLISPKHEEYITAYLRSSDDIISLVMAINALERRNLFPEDLQLVIPYFPYARQDRVCNPGEAHAVQVMAKKINMLGLKSVTIYDPHSDVTPALLDRCMIVPQNQLVQKIEWNDNYVIVSPDAGSEKKCLKLAQIVSRPMMRASKVRDVGTGEIMRTTLLDPIPKSFKFEQRLVIVDDICDGGRTFTELAKVLRAEGATTSIFMSRMVTFPGVRCIRWTN